MPIVSLIRNIVPALALTGCAYPSNVVNDITHMGDPTYNNCRSNANPASDYGAQCAYEADPKVKAAKALQAEQFANQKRLMIEAEQQRVIDEKNAELARGFSSITVRNFILDGKALAAQGAKVALTGAYMPVGNLEFLFETNIDAIQFANGHNQNSPTVYLITEDASRDFRSQLLACRSNPATVSVGCNVHVLGNATMCALSGPFGISSNVPCVSVDEGKFGGF